MKEIYAVVRRYRDRDRYTVYSGPETYFYESREEAQKVADDMNAPLLKRLADENTDERKRIDGLNREHDALVRAGLRRYRKPLEAFKVLSSDESYEVCEYYLHGVRDGT